MHSKHGKGTIFIIMMIMVVVMTLTVMTLTVMIITILMLTRKVENGFSINHIKCSKKITCFCRCRYPFQSWLDNFPRIERRKQMILTLAYQRGNGRGSRPPTFLKHGPRELPIKLWKSSKRAFPCICESLKGVAQSISSGLCPRL